MKYKIDKHSLLCDQSGWFIHHIQIGLKEHWRNIVDYFISCDETSVYNIEDIKRFESSDNPGQRLCEDLIQRNISIESLYFLFQNTKCWDLLLLIVEPEPMEFISRYPQNDVMYVSPGHELNIALQVTGLPPPVYQWYFSKNLISLDSKENNLTLHNFSDEMEGVYLCCMTQYINDEKFELWSCFEVLLKDTAPYYKQQPKDQLLHVGDELEVKCEAVGFPSLKYTWLKDDKVISHSSCVKVKCVAVENSGVYKCIIENKCGSKVSDEAKIIVKEEVMWSPCPQIIIQPCLEQTYPSRSIGQSIQLNCTIHSTSPVTFKWIVNGSSLPDSVGRNYRIVNSSDDNQHSSFLCYDVINNDSSCLRITCYATSNQYEVMSNEVIVKIEESSGPKTYYAHNKWALLIANGNYGLHSLSTPISDAEKLVYKLQNLGFRCLLMVDLTCSQLRNTMLMFSDLVDEGDYVVFFYGGHGFNFGEDLIIPVDAITEDEQVQLNNSISTVWIKNCIQIHKPALIFMIFDMCRTRTQISSGILQHQLNMLPQAERNSVTLFATTEGYACLEEPDCSSVLCKHLLRYLMNHVDIQSVARKVLQGINYESGEVTKAQIPMLHCDLPETRSLHDASINVNSSKLEHWKLITSTGGIHYEEMKIETSVIKVEVHCKTYKCISNIIDVFININYNGPIISLDTSINVPSTCLLRNDNSVIHRIKQAQNHSEELVVQLTPSLSRMDQSNTIIVHMGLPSVMKAALWRNNLSVS